MGCPWVMARLIRTSQRLIEHQVGRHIQRGFACFVESTGHGGEDYPTAMAATANPPLGCTTTFGGYLYVHSCVHSLIQYPPFTTLSSNHTLCLCPFTSPVWSLNVLYLSGVYISMQIYIYKYLLTYIFITILLYVYIRLYAYIVILCVQNMHTFRTCTHTQTHIRKDIDARYNTCNVYYNHIYIYAAVFRVAGPPPLVWVPR